MRSFTAIVAFASLAFATVASALPASTASFVKPPPEAAPYLSKDANLAFGTGGRNVAVEKRSPFGDEVGLSIAAALNPRGVEPSQGIPDIITALNDKIIPLCHDLSTLHSFLLYDQISKPQS